MAKSDDFNRADGSLGSNWATPTNVAALEIASNVVRRATAAHSAARHIGVTWGDDHDSQVKLTTRTNNTFNGGGPTVRANGSASAYWLQLNGGAGYRLLVFSNGVFGGTLGTYGVSTPPAGGSFRAEAIGTAIKAYDHNNVQRISVTDSTHASGAPGMWIDDATELDDWVGTGDAAATTNRRRRFLLAAG